MAHHVSAMSTVAIHSVTVVFSTSEENEHKYVRGCSAECRAHERNRYIVENGLTRQEWAERLEAIGGEFGACKRLKKLH